eukprot:CAMPEP_0201593958 /NCGR_PEP_ID=MMETSP0190_2-20130828/191423_1 /ASSEMBLY_ACC=CAM_ASM_000263 /TAXON_ID=37353 /ORGANISM="Rosalina sp." /LENGTH=356 /DNA_ID=CAMNT_0048053387 /DNA_START=657 /DNA_END=1723 /DNA_ORIENTATION=-
MKAKNKDKKNKKDKDKDKPSSDLVDELQNGGSIHPDFGGSSRSNSNKEVKFDGVPLVADFDDGSSDDGSDFSGNTSNMSASPMHRSYNEMDSRHIMVIIGSASSTTNNVFIDEYSLGQQDVVKSMENKKKSGNKSRCEQKDLIQNKVKFSISLENKKCETVKFSPNGKYFAIGGEACLYQIYERDTMKLIHSRYTKDNEDPIVIQRRPNLAAEYEKKRLKAIRDTTEEDDDDYHTECFVTCLSWINDHTVAVGNNKGAFIYISTILHEYKIRNFVLKEWISMIDKHYKICNDDKSKMNAENIIEEIHEFIGCDVIDNVIETNFGDRTSCLTSHPYFEMKPIDPNKMNNFNNSSIPT